MAKHHQQQKHTDKQTTPAEPPKQDAATGAVAVPIDALPDREELFKALQDELAAVTADRDQLRQKVATVEAHRNGDHNYTVAIEAKMQEDMAALIEERDRLKVRVSALESAAEAPPMPASGWSSEGARALVMEVPPGDREQLLGDLLVLLRPFVGETGANEGAADVLRRKLAELEAAQHARKESEAYAASLHKQCDAYEGQIQNLRSAMVARRAPGAGDGPTIEGIWASIRAAAPADWIDPMPQEIGFIVRAMASEWHGMRSFLSAQPLVAVALRDDSTASLKERYSLLLLEWNGKALDVTAVEQLMPWGDIQPRLRHLINTRLIPADFRG